MRAFDALFAALILGIVAQGCDPSGVHDLNVKIDRTSNCGASTWLRTTDTGTEVFQLGELDPTTQVSGEGSCFVWAFVEFDSTTTLEQGTYTLDETGNGVFEVDQVYHFPYQPNLSPYDRMGATVEDNPNPATRPLGITADGAEILLSLDGTARRLTNIYDVLADLDPTTLAGAENVYRMYNLSLFTSQVRILAFGGVGMTMYTSRKEFQALVAGSFAVHVEKILPATTRISYFGYEDLHGIGVEGDQVTIVDLAGSGGMEGALDFNMRDAMGGVLLSGSVGYENCVIVSGVAGGGTYTLTIDDPPLTYDLDYSLAANTDLRTLLPPSTP